MGERREFPKTQFDQRWETFVERCVCVCVIKKEGTMVGGPAPTIVGHRSPPYSILHQHDLHYTAMVL